MKDKTIYCKKCRFYRDWRRSSERCEATVTLKVSKSPLSSYSYTVGLANPFERNKDNNCSYFKGMGFWWQYRMCLKYNPLLAATGTLAVLSMAYLTLMLVIL